MKKLREKMISVVMLSTISVFALTWIIVCLLLVTYNTRQADGMTQIISVYNGEVPRIQEFKEDSFEDIYNTINFFNEESAFRTRYFVVSLNEDMQAQMADTEHIASIDEETACDMAEEAAAKGNTVGYIGKFRYRITTDNTDACIVIFVDCSESFSSQHVTAIILATISVIFTILVTLAFAVISNKVIKPFEENARKQKQFITDAGHELKTPLAIISANAEVLEYKTGSSEWLSNILGQVHNLGGLIDRLLTLSKMEEFSEELTMEPVNLSSIIIETLNDFTEVFLKKEVKLDTDISPDIVLNANTKQLSMLVSILIENASKYVTEHGLIRATLHNSGKNIVFQIYNTAILPDDIKFECLFDRFYRPDASHTSGTGGQGIGLSIARQIVLLHNGSIHAGRADDGICFTVELSGSIKAKTPKRTH